jgi:hypothetical protein
VSKESGRESEHCKLTASLSRNEYVKAIELWAERFEALAEISRSYFKLSRICLSLNDPNGAKDARDNAERLLARLGENLTEDSIQDLLPAWAK